MVGDKATYWMNAIFYNDGVFRVSDLGGVTVFVTTILAVKYRIYGLSFHH